MSATTTPLGTSTQLSARRPPAGRSCAPPPSGGSARWRRSPPRSPPRRTAEVAKAVGVPMEAGGSARTTAEAIPAGGFAVGTLIVDGALRRPAVVLARKAARPARTFVVLTVTGTVLSLGYAAAAGPPPRPRRSCCASRTWSPPLSRSR